MHKLFLQLILLLSQHFAMNPVQALALVGAGALWGGLVGVTVRSVCVRCRDAHLLMSLRTHTSQCDGAVAHHITPGDVPLNVKCGEPRRTKSTLMRWRFNRRFNSV
jgi:hypothetical protein